MPLSSLERDSRLIVTSAGSGGCMPRSSLERDSCLLHRSRTLSSLLGVDLAQDISEYNESVL